MSTNYYKLKKPITHISVENTGVYQVVNIWVNHGFAGIIMIYKDELIDILKLFSSDGVAYRSHYGGIEKGKVVKKVQGTDDIVVISEYGKIVKVEDLEKEVK